MLRGEADAYGVLIEQLRGSQLALYAELREPVAAEPPAVAEHEKTARFAAQLLRQLSDRDGAVGREAGEDAAFRFKERVVDLIAPRVHRADEQTVHVGEILRHRLERGNAEARLVRCPGEALDRGDADAQARERAGTGGHGDRIHVAERQLGVFEHGVHHRHQRARVGEAGALIGIGQRRAVFDHCGRNGLRRGLERENFHKPSTPVMVMTRQPSCCALRRKSMRTVEPSKASSARSLHSTAHTPPRAR